MVFAHEVSDISRKCHCTDCSCQHFLILVFGQVFGSSLFDLAATQLDLMSVLPAALIAGAVFGLVAALWWRSATAAVCRRQWLVISAPCNDGGFVTGTAGMFVPQALGLGGPLAVILDGGYDVAAVLLVFVCLTPA